MRGKSPPDNPLADFQEGWDAYMANDYATALREIRPHAERGNSDAQIVMGLMHGKGEGIPRNLHEAYVWFSLAAAAGNDRAWKGKDAISKALSAAEVLAAQKEAARRWQEIQDRNAEAIS